MKNTARLSIFLIATFLLTACSNGFKAGEQELAQQIEQNVGCKSFRDQTFSALYDYLDKSTDDLSEYNVSSDLKEKILNLPSENTELKIQLADEVANLLTLLNSKTKSSFNTQTNQEHLQKLIELEFQNTSTVEHKIANEKIQASFDKIKALAEAAEISCQHTEDSVVVTRTPANHPLYGLRFAFATAYQTCESLDLPAMDAKTENVVGVKIGAKNGGGYKREYGNIRDIARTHYYINRAHYGSSCFNVAAKPLLYDYGGAPAVNSSKNLIDFFTNAGTGGGALGIDCSAFVSSGLAAAGLRYTPGVSNKSIYIRQTSQTFIDPVKSGWKCFARIPVSATQSLASGDIMAVDGHVVMIDRVGQDPFGISRVTAASQCAKLSVTDFDFVVMQSSPSKSSIGINRYEARDYLLEHEKMRNGFLKYAKATCIARLEGKTVVPGDTTVGIIRHKGTPECLDKRVQLVNESCVQSCTQFSE